VSKKALGAKIIVAGKLSKKLNVKGDVRASKGARAAIEAAGGTIEVIEKPVKQKKEKKKMKAEPEAEAKA
jgi:ribosomal protein L18E